MPVLYLSAGYTMAGASLERLRDTEPMRVAFEGMAVIQVDGDADYDELRPGYWHSFHALDGEGRPTGAALDPGNKHGPCSDGDAAACAAWVRPFTRTLRADAG